MARSGFIWLALLLVACLLVPAVAPAQTPQVPPLSQDKDYIIGPEDILEIQVWGNKDLNQTVFVREIRSRPVFFIGAFVKPGVMQLTRELSLLQAISVIGGVVPNADSEKGFLLRGDKRIPIDFNRLLQRGDLSQNPKLEPGDSVVLPAADAVYVNGEVRLPGAVKYTQDLTILKALTQVGGLTQLAAGGRVDVLRGNAEKKERIRVDVDKMMRSPDENPDIRLQPNDIIFVPQRLF